MNKRAAESELRLKRLYDAIEGVPPIWTIRALKTHRRPQGYPPSSQGRCRPGVAHAAKFETEAVTPQMLHKFAATARERLRMGGAIAVTTSARWLSVSRSRGRGSHRGIEVPVASDAGGGHRRKLNAHSGTEVAERRDSTAMRYRASAFFKDGSFMQRSRVSRCDPAWWVPNALVHQAGAEALQKLVRKVRYATTKRPGQGKLVDPSWTRKPDRAVSSTGSSAANH